MLGESEHWMLELKLILVCVKSLNPPPPLFRARATGKQRERDSNQRQTLSSSPAQLSYQTYILINRKH